MLAEYITYCDAVQSASDHLGALFDEMIDVAILFGALGVVTFGSLIAVPGLLLHAASFCFISVGCA